MPDSLRLTVRVRVNSRYYRHVAAEGWLESATRPNIRGADFQPPVARAPEIWTTEMALRLAMCGYGRHRWAVFVNSCFYFLAAKYFFKAARSRRPGDHVVRPAVPRAFRRENLLERESRAVKLFLCSAVHLSHSRTGCTQQQKKGACLWK